MRSISSDVISPPLRLLSRVSCHQMLPSGDMPHSRLPTLVMFDPHATSLSLGRHVPALPYHRNIHANGPGSAPLVGRLVPV
jgi:hypothetical protein